MDLVEREKLLPILDAYKALFDFKAMIPISALHQDGTELLMKELLQILPEGPRLYPQDIPTDVTERFIASEIIREKIFHLTSQEVPYSCAVLIERFKEDEKDCDKRHYLRGEEITEGDHYWQAGSHAEANRSGCPS